LKVEKRYISVFRKQAQLSFPTKKLLGVRVEANIPNTQKQ